MNENPVYLKLNFVAEPLIDNWYGWAHLVSPATACLNIKNRHVPIMKSYALSPMAHAAAVKNPKMLGGPFIDYEGKRVPEVKEVLENTTTENSEMIAFAEGFEKLNELLQQEAKGFSMEAIYEKIPAALKGYVELIYDAHNHPSIRINEALLFKSKYHKPEIQSYHLQLLHDDERPFVFSTPRLNDENKLKLKIPFEDKAMDELFKMQRTPQSFTYISDLLNIEKEDLEMFSSFFTEEKPVGYNKYEGDFIRTRYFGHACILIETKDMNILIDPCISYQYNSETDRQTMVDLPEKLDYVIITHNHQDHILLETMLHLRHKIGTIVFPRNRSGVIFDPSLKLILKNIGFEDLVEMEQMDELSIPGGKISCFPFYGEHGDLDVNSKLGYLVNLAGYKILCLADSNNIEPELYKLIHEIHGDVDVLFLGMECDGAPISWVYGSYFKIDREKDQTRRLSGSNYKAGMDIVSRFNCKEVYIYAMGQEPWVKYLTSVIYTDESNPIIQSNQLLEDCKAQGLIAERLFGQKEILSKNSL